MLYMPQRMRGSGLFARALRGSTWTIAGYAGSQLLRLASNLVLTRLLFPEAFGLMALVMVVITGLVLFSDIGLGPSIMQNPRGDDRDFLDTAWSIQVIRGFILWLATCAAAWPMAKLYGEPMLAQILPVAGITLLISGFNPTRILSANRHLLLGRVTLLDLVSQTLSLAFIIVAAWATGSVWALVASLLVGAAIKLLLTHYFLPGVPNRLRWEARTVRDLLHFGKWIFLSTICAFVISQGDRAVLGVYLSIEQLGIYNIGYMLATFPALLGGMLVGRMLLPLYRERPPSASPENFAKFQRMRFALTGGLMALGVPLAFFGVPLVDLLFDSRYAPAGAIVVLIACVQIPQFIGMSYSQVALAAGDSRRFFMLTLAQAVVLPGFFIIGAELDGLTGALAGLGAAYIVTHGVHVWLAQRFGAWDPLHDSVYAAIGGIAAASALWYNRAPLEMLSEF